METYISTQCTMKSHIYVHCFYIHEIPAGATPADLALDGTWLPASNSQCASSRFILILSPLVRSEEDWPVCGADGTRGWPQQAEGCSL